MQIWHAVAIFAALSGAQVSHAEPPNFDVWPASLGATSRVDVEQLVEDRGSHVAIVEGLGAGQVFVPHASPLARIDVRLRNMGDQRAGRISIYRWRGSHGPTVAQKPLWSDGVDLSGDDALRTYSFLPRIELEPGAAYFIELEAPNRGAYSVNHSNDGTDHYRDGALRHQGKWRKNWDMWFRTLTDAKPQAAHAKPAPRSLDARRSMFKAHAPPRRAKKVTRRSYYNRIARYTNAVRVAMLNNCGRQADEYALLEAFLYRVSCEEGTCKEKHATHVRDLYRDSYAWRSCREGSLLLSLADPREPRCAQICEGKRVSWNPKRRATTAYLWTRDSPAYTTADHERIQEHLADLGRRMWGQLELGTHNRPLQLAVTYRVLSDLLPDAPEASEWRRYSDRIWRELFEAGDTSEDSTEYASVVWWPAVLEYLAVTGTEAEVFADPRFRGWVERAYQLMTPIGPAADLGNSVGFGHDTAGWVWLFEAAARHYREPRFREAAQRAFRFHEGHVRDEQPAHDALSQTLGSVAWAYFAADPSVGASPPAVRDESVVNVPVADASHAWHVAEGEVMGQRFRATDLPLVRLDFRSSGGSATRVVVSLWHWQGDVDATRKAQPLFRAEARVADDGAIEAFPFIDAASALDYFVELRPIDGSLRLAGAPSGAALATSPEALVTSSGEEPGANLWYRAYSLRGLGSTVTSRLSVRALSKSELGPPPYDQYEVGGDEVPDKLVLRSGFEPGSFFAVFNLVHEYGHGEAEQGALVSVVDGGSILLQDGPYPYWLHQRQRQDESRPMLLRHSGGTLGEVSGPARIDHFRDARAATVVRFSFEEPRGWGARIERRVFFVKDRFMFVRDCFTSPEPIRASFGTLWHPTDVAAKHGPNWFDIFVRSPLANVRRIRNTPRRMLVEFLPKAGTTTEGFLEASYEPVGDCPPAGDTDSVRAECRSGPPYVLSQWMTGSVVPGQDRCFDTLLIPHPPEEPAARLAQDVRVLRADDRTVALELRLGDETWLVVDDTSKQGVAIEGLEARVRYAIARARPGTAPYVLASDARKLRWAGFDGDWGVPVSFEVGAHSGRRESHATATDSD